jgi:DNA-binding response OmpR family regulator
MADPAKSATSIRVLVVEDDRVTARTLQNLLGHYGYAVKVAHTVREAIEQLDALPQIILLDFNLPDGDGSQVMAAVRSRGLDARVAVVTAEMDHDRLRRLNIYRPDVTLQKPLDFFKLLEHLQLPVE